MRGRLTVTPGLLLSSRPHRESDRVCVLYSRDYGKLQARFVSVDRPQGKLKALAEPLVLAEYRLHIRDGAESAVAAGGALVSVFPGLRQDLGLTLRGLQVLELLDRLTPYWNPSPEKFDLTVECLSALERSTAPSAGPWVTGAFGLRLLDAAGFGVGQRKVSEENADLWEALHNAPFEDVLALPPHADLQARLESFVKRSVEVLIQQPLQVPAVSRSVTAALKRTALQASKP